MRAVCLQPRSCLPLPAWSWQSDDKCSIRCCPCPLHLRHTHQPTPSHLRNAMWFTHSVDFVCKQLATPAPKILRCRKIAANFLGRKCSSNNAKLRAIKWNPLFRKCSGILETFSTVNLFCRKFAAVFQKIATSYPVHFSTAAQYTNTSDVQVHCTIHVKRRHSAHT